MRKRIHADFTGFKRFNPEARLVVGTNDSTSDRQRVMPGFFQNDRVSRARTVFLADLMALS
jgi:hypothetical protein